MNDICGAVSFKGYYHVFLDKSVLEVFVNDGRACVTQVVYPGPGDLGLEVFAEGGRATLLSLDVWQMASIWPRYPFPKASQTGSTNAPY